MAEKILNTRIQLKYDIWDNWQKTDVANKGGNLVLKQGEMAVTAIASGKSDFTTPPTVMFKVGDGEHKFSELPWASGLAADVYPWAKAALPPDTDTQYQLVLSGHTLKLQSKAKGATAWSDVSGQSFTLPDNDTTYTFAEGTTNGAFTVTPSNGTATSVKVHGLGTAAYKATGDFATAAQGAKADSAIQSVKSLDTTATTSQATAASEAIQGNGKIILHKVSKTGSYTDLLNKPTIPSAANNGALTIKVGANGDVSGTGTFTANQSSAGTITLPVYTKTEIGSIVIDGGEIN